MVRRVTVDDIKQMNILYLKLHSYAAVAREVGFSAATVRNYIDPNFSLATEDQIHRFDPNTELPEFSTDMFTGVDDYGTLCEMSDEEYEEIKQLWVELPL